MSRTISLELEKQVCDLYDNGSGTVEIARLVNRHRGVIQQILLRNNVKLRKTSPYKNKYNVKYFDRYTPENCYWAGFILADGCIRTDRDAVEIHLQEGDKGHLLKFAKEISFTGNLIPDKSSNAYTIAIAGKWFPKYLKDLFSIEGRKSLTAVFPSQLPKEYWSQFIRGYFDGDGCISYIEQSNGRLIPTISFIGTSYFLDILRVYFYDIGVDLKSKNIYAPIVSHEVSNGIGTISYSGVNAIKILNNLYQDCDDMYRLDRKFSRYSEFIQGYYGE